jgi:MoaE-MoaD fusion protein
MNKVKVLFFASLQARAGTASVELEIPANACVRDLKQQIIQRFPQMESMLGSTLVSVNREFAFGEDIIPPGAEVALFPPVSGGSSDFPTFFAISEGVLDLDDLLNRITLPSTGAACLFTGMVRGVTQRGEAHDTLYLEYEAYQSMAEAKMRQVADEIRLRWPSVEGIAIVQRIGRLYPGTPTVLIACTAAHRDTGVFEAARYGIDRLKEIVPVWKKEVGSSGESWVEGNYLPTDGD